MPRYIDADKLPELFAAEFRKTRELIENGEERPFLNVREDDDE